MTYSKVWGFVGIAAASLFAAVACGDEATTPVTNPPVKCATGGAGSCSDAKGSGGGAGSGGASRRDAGAGGASAGSGGKRIDGGGPDARADASRDACPDGHCTECSAGQSLCGSVCVDTKNDPKNCGKCGNGCGAQTCSNGSCSACSTTGEIQGAPATTTVTFAGATDQVALPCEEAPGPDRIYTFTAPETATYVFGTPGESAAVGVFDGCGGTVLACEANTSRYTATAYIGKGVAVMVVVQATTGTSPVSLGVRKAEPDACCEEHTTAGCGNAAIEACVCATASGCCSSTWTATCDALVNSLGCGLCQVDRPPSCGGTSCAPFGATEKFLGVGQCCTSKNECGAYFAGGCAPRDQHGLRDSACPTELVANITATGCCRTDGRCGIDLSRVGMGCVAREEAPGTSFSPVGCGSGAVNSLPDFRNFESDQVRPLALSPDGSKLFAVNTPDDRLEVYSVSASGLVHVDSIPVGLEPVSVAARTDTEVWVVNQVSDDVSVVDFSTTPARIARTLWLGDEPRDIVFAGAGGKRAFITTAHRGQNSPVDPQLLTPSVGRADVWVFDVDSLGQEPGGTPVKIVTLFGDTPRALAVTPDGSTVYAAVYHSGNRTTVVGQAAIGLDKLPPPTQTIEGIQQPPVSLIVKFDGQNWVDELGHSWDDQVKFTLPDFDVFAIDATRNPPAESTRFSGVGTTLFNMAVNPVSGALYVSNTEAHNEIRFEPGVRAKATTTQVTVISGNQVAPHSLNPHIDFSNGAGSTAERGLSVGHPTGIAVSPDGASLYVAALGSSKVSVVNTADLEAGTYMPTPGTQIALSGGGPTGLVLDGVGQRLYVLTRFDNGISILDVSSGVETGHVTMPTPEPLEVLVGRPVLYDTKDSSAHGDLSCMSCHTFADTDHLAWDLGDPNGKVVGGFHPMKGPMATQSLRGMANHGPMHWRGDRSGGLVPGGDFHDTTAAFRQFNPAFVGLLGRASQLAAPDMDRFTKFILTVTYPPNPIRSLDGSLTPAEQAGRNIFFNVSADPVSACNGACHITDVPAGFFGTDGRSQFDAEPQNFKVPHLRNAYQKVGMFGRGTTGFGIPSTEFMGDQIRGLGYSHDGAVDNLIGFLSSNLFSLTPAERIEVASFVLAFDSEMDPIVGQQVTVTAATADIAKVRFSLLVEAASTGSPRRICDLVGHGTVGGEARGYVLRSTGTFASDRAADAPMTPLAMLTALSQDSTAAVTFTCMPPGSGMRAGIDRDRDGKLDRDELDSGTDPADPASK